MSRFRAFLFRFRGLLRRRALESELSDELHAHVDELTERNRAAGMTPDEARYAALRTFGGVEQIKERARDERRSGWGEHLAQDTRYAFRQLRRNPGFALITIVTLGLGIGATTAISSTVYSLMLKPLPFHDAARLIEIYNTAAKNELTKLPGSIKQYLDYSENATSYETLGLWRYFEGTFGEGSSVARLSGARATAGMFPLLRVQPVIGRFFTNDNNRPGEDKVAVLTQSFWETHFGQDPAVLEKTVWIDGEALRVIGVAPRVLEAFDARIKIIRPLSWTPQAATWRHALNVQLFGRLKPGVTLQQAAAESGIMARRYYDEASPSSREFMNRSGITDAVGSLQTERVESVRGGLYLLQGGVAFVLLIVCVNVGNLLLVRAQARQPELAIRYALGAGRKVIARQMLVESLVLAGLGALLGLVLAWSALGMFNRYIAEILPQALPMTLDLRVLAFAAAITTVVGVGIGLLPVVHLLRSHVTKSMQRNSRGASASRGMRTFSSMLVMGQVAVALVLLTGAGLLIRAFVNAVSVEPGFDPGNVVTARIALPSAHRSSDQAAKAIQERLILALGEIPGVSSVALSFSTPFRSGLAPYALTLAEDPRPPGSPQPMAGVITVTPGYLETMRLRLVEGRFFEPADAAPGRRAFVVDESFARTFFAGRSAIGGRFTITGPPGNEAEWPTIIGVVRDVPHNGVEDRTGNPFAYQLPQWRPSGLVLFVRTARPVADVIAAIREKVRGIDSMIPVFEASSLESVLDASFNQRRAVMLLLAAFGGIALFLAALGLYGLLAYDVSRRTREIGIRGAIGATRGQIIEMILKQGLWRAGVGLLVGLIGARLLSGTMTRLLFDVKPTDPMVQAGVSVLLLLVAALASYLPARRAAKVDPMVALRAE